MRKVSRSMLATIAALQSGAHSRRKVRYLREQALVSDFYPYIYSERAIGSVAFTGAKFFDVPILLDSTRGSLSFSGGELVQLGPIEYTAHPEITFGTVSFIGGEVKEVVVKLSAPQESALGSLALVSGELKVVVVNYDNYEIETVGSEVSFIGGSLEVV